MLLSNVLGDENASLVNSWTGCHHPQMFVSLTEYICTLFCSKLFFKKHAVNFDLRWMATELVHTLTNMFPYLIKKFHKIIHHWILIFVYVS